MRLSYTTGHITDTVLIDESGRQLYATTSTTFGRTAKVLKLGSFNPSTIASIRFHSWSTDTIIIHDRKVKAKEYLRKPSWWSKRRVISCASNQTYEWIRSRGTWKLRIFNGPEVGRAQARSHHFKLCGTKKHPSYLEFDHDPRVQNDLDELVATFVYLQIRRKRDEGWGEVFGAGAEVTGAIS